MSDTQEIEESLCMGCMRDTATCDGDCREYNEYMLEHFSGAVAMERKEAMGLPWDALLPESEEEKKRQALLRRKRGIIWEKDEKYIQSS